ncbi:VanW family protein [Bacillus songklensis]|uniref:VanW family protein n=1 Tax=Bacillus songklensis TaxID=1069116 RepID=A0ABV8BA52_9BACI
MKLTWMAGLLLLVQQLNLPDSLSVKQHEQTIAIVNRADFTTSLPGVQMIDTNKYDRFIEKLDQQVYQAPVNAAIDDQGKILPGHTGHKLYRQAFTEKFYTYFFSKGPSTVEVPLLTIYPKVDSELLSNIRVQRIGQYMTYFNSNNKTRSHNISLATKAINNYVVFPGETFSFNKVVGKRTEDKGYMRAPVIVKGEMSEGIGGGICQVSSTLYNAVDNAGIKIVQRYSHSRRVPYVPPGRDATVSWYGPDFRFQNNYNQPILIRAKTYGARMIVTIYSSESINYEPKKAPSASDRLPQEMNEGADVTTEDR